MLNKDNNSGVYQHKYGCNIQIIFLGEGDDTGEQHTVRPGWLTTRDEKSARSVFLRDSAAKCRLAHPSKPKALSIRYTPTQRPLDVVTSVPQSGVARSGRIDGFAPPVSCTETRVNRPGFDGGSNS